MAASSSSQEDVSASTRSVGSSIPYDGPPVVVPSPCQRGRYVAASAHERQPSEIPEENHLGAALSNDSDEDGDDDEDGAGSGSEGDEAMASVVWRVDGEQGTAAPGAMCQRRLSAQRRNRTTTTTTGADGHVATAGVGDVCGGRRPPPPRSLPPSIRFPRVGMDDTLPSAASGTPPPQRTGGDGVGADKDYEESAEDRDEDDGVVGEEIDSARRRSPQYLLNVNGHRVHRDGSGQTGGGVRSGGGGSGGVHSGHGGDSGDFQSALFVDTQEELPSRSELVALLRAKRHVLQTTAEDLVGDRDGPSTFIELIDLLRRENRRQGAEVDDDRLPSRRGGGIGDMGSSTLLNDFLEARVPEAAKRAELVYLGFRYLFLEAECESAVRQGQP